MEGWLKLKGTLSPVAEATAAAVDTSAQHRAHEDFTSGEQSGRRHRKKARPQHKATYLPRKRLFRPKTNTGKVVFSDPSLEAFRQLDLDQITTTRPGGRILGGSGLGVGTK
jgi:hypothetical protein